MKVKVTQRGVTIPRRMLGDAVEVEVRTEEGRVVLTPVLDEDPILGMGEEPVMTGTSDGAANHDRHLYGSNGPLSSSARRVTSGIPRRGRLSRSSAPGAPPEQ